MIKVLIIGCGNIGCLYDIDYSYKYVLTHIRAYSLNKKTEIYIYDPDLEKTQYISSKYDVKIIENIDDDILKSFDIVSICTDTNSHYYYLSKLLKLKTPVILCEKPVTYNFSEINELLSLYRRNSSKILINYIRRFNNEYLKLKDILGNILSEDKLQKIFINYSGGFINNGSHALDLLNFLFEKKADLNSYTFLEKEYDKFNNDPSLSIIFKNGYFDEFIFFTYIKSDYFIFEIDILFEKNRIIISDSGNNISIYKKSEPDIENIYKSLDVFYKKNNILFDYMNDVIEYSIKLLENNINDNFLDSLNLNSQMLSIIEEIRR